MWKNNLPFAFKCYEKDYLSKMMQCLKKLFNRFYCFEKDCNSKKGSVSLLFNFIVNFLVKEVFIRQSVYPGTVLDEEMFGLSTAE